MPEQRVVLKNCGIIDPGRIATYLTVDGFKALKKARDGTPAQVIQEVKDSGLRGRGGAGFPCGLKWEMARNAPGDDKYVICNADEGEVGTFKDRHILSNDPFTLIEVLLLPAMPSVPATAIFTCGLSTTTSTTCWWNLSIRSGRQDSLTDLKLLSAKAPVPTCAVKNQH